MINKILCKMWGHGKTYPMIGPNNPFRRKNAINWQCKHCDEVIKTTHMVIDRDSIAYLSNECNKCWSRNHD